VGVVVAALGTLLLMKGINNLKGSALVPQRTIEQVRADFSVAREQVHEGSAREYERQAEETRHRLAECRDWFRGRSGEPYRIL
jgi:hypothetical protein